MKLSRAFQLVFFSVLGAATSEASARTWSIEDLGIDVYPVAVNDSGVVAAETSGAGRARRARLYRGSRSYKLPPQSWVTALSGDDAVGYYNDGPHGLQAAIWPNKAEAIYIDPPAGGEQPEPQGITRSLNVAGNYYFGANERCFEWTKQLGSIDIGVMEGHAACHANGMNAAGQIVGNADLHAFVWKNSQFSDLGSYQDEFATTAVAINRKGTIIGYWVDFSHYYHAVAWTGGVMASLDPNFQHQETKPYAINNSGDIVGARVDQGQTFAALFVHGDVIDLSTRVTNIGDWTLVIANDISDDATIAGYGFRGGQVHGFRLVPTD